MLYRLHEFINTVKIIFSNSKRSVGKPFLPRFDLTIGHPAGTAQEEGSGFRDANEQFDRTLNCRIGGRAELTNKKC